MASERERGARLSSIEVTDANRAVAPPRNSYGAFLCWTYRAVTSAIVCDSTWDLVCTSRLAVLNSRRVRLSRRLIRIHSSGQKRGNLNKPFMHQTEKKPLLPGFIINDAYVVKRKHVSGVDWAGAVAKVMAANKDLKTQTALARKSGVAQSTIGRILRGEVNPQSVNLERIAKAFSMSLAKLAEMGQGKQPVAESTDDLKSVERSARVALIPWAQAGSFTDASDNPQPGDGEEWMPQPKYSGDRTFALRVRGESMEPDYQHGDIIFVDPDVTPAHGKDVVVQLGGRNEVVFKRLVVEGRLEYLKPANPNWPDKIIEISAYPGARIIGVVIGKWVEK
ncbi:MAG: hypothetical protein JWL65_3770 [Gammaproteobacteria bacterium]|nr:hypothetical protein [Gammaproteobacteria bacterium]